MNSELGMHRGIETCLERGARMEAILDEHPDEFALPGARHTKYIMFPFVYNVASFVLLGGSLLSRVQRLLVL